MSIPTFDTVRNHNKKNIRKALSGLVLVKHHEDDDTELEQIYTAAGGLLIPAGYTDVGILSKSSAVKQSRESGTEDVASWGYGQPTRRDITTDVSTLQFSMQESKRVVMELYNSTDLSGVTPDSDKNIVIDKPTRPQSIDWRVLVLSKDGDGADTIYWADWYPLANVTAFEDQENSEATEKLYTVTITGFEDPVFRTAHRQIWGGPGINPQAMGFAKKKTP